MGQPLLNDNRTTTAFYDALPVHDFMRQYLDKPLNSNYSDDNIATLQAVLKSCKVFISYQKRAKPIISLGKPPKDQTFPKKGKDSEAPTTISVTAHLRDENSEQRPDYSLIHLLLTQIIAVPSDLDVFKASRYPCVNVGSRGKSQFIPADLVKIIPYQVFKGHLPGDEAEHMIELAREQPYDVRKHITEDGLELLGLKDTQSPVFVSVLQEGKLL
jgi:hypothetical protein